MIVTALRLAGTEILLQRRHEDGEGIADRPARHAQRETQRHQHPGNEPVHEPSLAMPSPLRQPQRRGRFRAAEGSSERHHHRARGFNGPVQPVRSNGGYVAGVLAARFTQTLGGDGTVEITLRAPIPIDRKLQVMRDGGALMLRDGDTLVCEARAGTVAHLTPPPAPTDWAACPAGSARLAGSAGEDSEFQECLVWCKAQPRRGRRLARVRRNGARRRSLAVLLCAACRACRCLGPHQARVRLGHARLSRRLRAGHRMPGRTRSPALIPASLP